jgi:hypothetical protein
LSVDDGRKRRWLRSDPTRIVRVADLWPGSSTPSERSAAVRAPRDEGAARARHLTPTNRATTSGTLLLSMLVDGGFAPWSQRSAVGTLRS